MSAWSLSTVRQRLARDDTAVAVAFYGAVVLYAGWLVVTASQYRPDTRLFPTIVGSAVLALVALRVVASLVGQRLGFESTGLFDHLQTDGDGGEPVRRGVVVFGWLVLLVGLFRLVGPLAAIAVVTGGFVTVHRGTTRTALLLSLGVTAAVFVLFVVVLDLPGYDPLLFDLLGGRR